MIDTAEVYTAFVENGKYILQAVEDSFQRLQTDYIDLYQSHHDDLNTPIEKKVRVIGASQCTPERLEKNVCRER